MDVLKPVVFSPINAVSGTGKSRRRDVTGMSAVSFSPPNKNPEDFQHHSVQIPKMEPFNRGKISRWMKEPSLIEKAESAIMDLCSTLEGDEAYNCWEAFFEFENMVKESKARSSAPDRSLDRIENLVMQSGGVKSLIENVRMVAKASKLHRAAHAPEQIGAPSLADDVDSMEGRPFPEPDGLPKSQQELEEEEKARMPDSPYTRLLRRKGWFPPWYSPHPDNETD